MLALVSMPLQSWAADMDLRWHYSMGGRGKYVYVEDLDSDGIKELVVVAGDDLYVIDKNGELMWKPGVDDIVSVCVSDLERDNKKEVVVSSGRTIGNVARGDVRAFESDGELRWTFPPSRVKSNRIMREIKAVDMDGNGYKELVGGTGYGIAAIADNYNEFLWYNSINNSIDAISTDLKGRILANSDSKIFLVSFDGSVEWNYTVSEGIGSMYFSDFYPGVGDEVFVVSLGESIYVLNTGTGLEAEIDTGFEDFHAMPVNLDDDDYDEFLLASGKTTYAMDIDNRIIWEYEADEEILGIIEDEGSGVLLFGEKRIYAIGRDGELQDIYDPVIGHIIDDVIVDDLENDNEREFIVLSLTGVYVLNINRTRGMADNGYGKAGDLSETEEDQVGNSTSTTSLASTSTTTLQPETTTSLPAVPAENHALDGIESIILGISIILIVVVMIIFIRKKRGMKEEDEGGELNMEVGDEEVIGGGDELGTEGEDEIIERLGEEFMEEKNEG